MKGDILLHPTKGVNPRLMYCNRCHGDSQELCLLGADDGIFECRKCKLKHIGKPAGTRCPKCNTYDWKYVRDLEDNESLPSMQPCDKCLEESHKEVEKGGVYFKCVDCKAEGVIKASAPFARNVRDHAQIQAPDPVGVEFTKKDCPNCNKEVV